MAVISADDGQTCQVLKDINQGAGINKEMILVK
jgi:hypothetical protein